MSKAKGDQPAGQTEVEFDRFGFKLDPNAKPLSREEIRKINSRAMKWHDMVNNWDEWSTKRRAKLKSRIRKGIPETVRGFVWQRVSGSIALRDANPGLYHQLLLTKESSYEEMIQRDLARTFPDHLVFRNDSEVDGQTNMFNVLKAYSVYNETVGYCQGMPFVAGMFLMYMPEEDAFWMLVAVMTNYDMEALFKPGLPALNQYIFQFEKLVQQHHPKLSDHMEKEGVITTMYASQWFMTYYIYSFPFQTALRIWDIFLGEGKKGCKIIFRVALATMKVAEDKLLTMGLERLLPYLKEEVAHQHPDMQPDVLIKNAHALSLKTKQLEALMQEYKEIQRGYEQG